MRLLLVPLCLTCGPAILSTITLVRTVQAYGGGHLRPFALWAVGSGWLITAYAAYVFLRYTIHPLPDLPPWKDPETLDLALLFLLAPIGLVLTVIAGIRGAPRAGLGFLVAALLVLFLVGLLEGVSV